MLSTCASSYSSSTNLYFNYINQQGADIAKAKTSTEKESGLPVADVAASSNIVDILA